MPFVKPFRSLLFPVFLLAGVLLLHTPLGAQQPPGSWARFVVKEDTTLTHRQISTGVGRWDATDRVFRALYQPQHLPVPPSSPEEAARASLRQEAQRLGIHQPEEELRFLRKRQTPGGTHVIFQQVVGDIPVYRRTVTVSLNRALEPTMIVSAYRPLTTPRHTIPTHRAEELLQEVDRLFPTPKRVSEPQLLFYPSKHPVLVWRWVVWPESPRGEWEVLIRADTGTPLLVRNQALQRKPQEDGQGMVFDPDPLTTSGHDYSPPYVDNNDADVPELNAQRITVTLRDLGTDADGRYILSGPYVQITGETAHGSVVYTPPAEMQPDAFMYTRANDHFEAVNAYYHIDRSQRYVQNLGFTDIHNYPLRVNPHGEGNADNSQYYPDLDFLSLGDGGIDDGEDASVLLHEYAHALLSASTPGLLSTYEGRAFQEGWADYWAASYLRELSESGRVPPFDWRELFRWDGNNGSWQGRYLQHTGRYPEDMTYQNIYADGLLWAATLMEIYDEVGRTVCDRLNLQSHAYLNGSSFAFTDAARALIQADRDLYDGAHMNTLLRILGNRGFVNPATYGPVIQHTPLSDTESLGTSREVRASVESVASTVDSVWVYFRWGTAGSWQFAPLQPDTGNAYRGMLPLPAQPDSVYYYFRAQDAQGLVTLLPQRAPETNFRFFAGPDTQPPTILHDPPSSVSLTQWPVIVLADVQDNLGVDTVRVHYEWLREGQLQEQGVFGLERNEKAHIYTTAFPIDREHLQVGDQIRYRIEAVDRAGQPNTAWLPSLEEPPFTFSLTLGGLLALYTFETPDSRIEATGLWERGEPSFGTFIAHSPTQVWGTRLNTSYPAETTLSTLTLPPLNLQGLSSAYLVLWHWYDTEHAGDAHPDNPDGRALLWDGGNVQISTDGGQSWEPLTPLEGYSGIIGTDFGNPLAGQPAFGGFSYGWRRNIFPLPGGQTVHIRFSFGTDGSNQDQAEFFAGWYIDDVQITTDLPVDEAPPRALKLPPYEQVLPAQDLFARVPLSVAVTDDTGIEGVHVVYTLEGPTHTYSGRYRLPMSPFSLDRFEGDLPLPSTAPGDVLTYTFEARDFAGHIQPIRTPGGEPFQITFRLMEERHLLPEVQATGAWQRLSDGAWVINATRETPPSSLILPVLNLPENAADIALQMLHRGHIPGEAGGTVVYSTDDGHSWHPLPPRQGYPDTLTSGIPVFHGQWDTTLTTFDLTPFAGEQVRVRVDFIPGTTALWEIHALNLVTSTEDPAFSIPLTLRLHANYPDPFSYQTTLGFTLPEATHVRLELFDMLGRRVRLLLDEMREPGTYHLSLDGSNLANGTYILRLTAMGQQLVEKLIIIH